MSPFTTSKNPMTDLRVELYGELVGHLVGADRRTFDVIATKQAIETFGLGRTILSKSVPFDLIAKRSTSLDNSEQDHGILKGIQRMWPIRDCHQIVWRTIP